MSTDNPIFPKFTPLRNLTNERLATSKRRENALLNYVPAPRVSNQILVNLKFPPLYFLLRYKRHIRDKLFIVYTSSPNFLASRCCSTLKSLGLNFGIHPLVPPGLGCSTGVPTPAKIREFPKSIRSTNSFFYDSWFKNIVLIGGHFNGWYVKMLDLIRVWGMLILRLIMYISFSKFSLPCIIDRFGRFEPNDCGCTVEW